MTINEFNINQHNKYIDSEVGKIYNNIKVLEFHSFKLVGTKGKRTSLCKFLCLHCNTEFINKLQKVRRGVIKSCGCMPNMAKNISKARSKMTSRERVLKDALKKYTTNARVKERDFELTYNQFCEFVSGDCHYCGEPPIPRTSKQILSKLKYRDDVTKEVLSLNGIDRINSEIGYTLNNCVSCCEICNKAKRDLTQKEFYRWIQRLSRHQQRKVVLLNE